MGEQCAVEQRTYAAGENKVPHCSKQVTALTLDSFPSLELVAYYEAS